MTAKKKKIISGVGILIIIFLVGYWIYPKENKNSEYIFDKSYNITLEDVKKVRTPLPGEKTSLTQNINSQGKDGEKKEPQNYSAAELKKIFSEGLINSHTTLKYFKHLEYMFRKSKTLGEHLDKVRQYLFSQFSEAEAQELFDTYKKYLNCEMALVDEFHNLTTVKSMDEAIDTLKRIQDFRRAKLGDELADKLFGADVKAKEYAFRRAKIVGDASLYGKKKEEELQKLNEDMWGDEAGSVETFTPDTPKAWQRFNEKKEIYKKDLDELPSADERKAKIEEYRSEYFSPEVVKRLDKVDEQVASEKQTETEYRDKAKSINEDTAISEEQKNQKIKDLQNKMFGKDADAFRRRENMRVGLEKMMKEYPMKK